MKRRVKDVLNFVDNTNKDLTHISKIGAIMGVIPWEVENTLNFVRVIVYSASLAAHAVDEIEQKGGEKI